MIQVQFDSVGPGRCGWCKKDKDAVYNVSFSDKSFVGPMCKADLLRAVEMKVPAKAASVPEASKPNVQPMPVAAK